MSMDQNKIKPIPEDGTNAYIATAAPAREATDLTMATVVKQWQLGGLLQR